MNSIRLSDGAKVLLRSLVAICGSSTMACGGNGVPPTPPAPGTASLTQFTVTNNTAATPESFKLANTGTVVNFYGTVTVTGATTDVVDYFETAGAATGGCPVAGKTVVETLTFEFTNAMTFAPNGSFGSTTGLLDTVFSTTATGPFTGAIYQYGTCTVFSPAQSVSANGGTSYEYPGGGNTSIPLGTYLLEIYH